MARKRSYIPQKFESKCFGDPSQKFIDVFGKSRKDSFCMIFDSLLESAAYIDLSFKQKSLYILCAAQFYGHRKPEKDYDEEWIQGPDKFYLNWHEVHKRYKMYPDDNQGRFYRDMTVLEEHGFIKKISSGKTHHSKSVYQFDYQWQFWEPPKPNPLSQK